MSTLKELLDSAVRGLVKPACDSLIRVIHDTARDAGFARDGLHCDYCGVRFGLYAVLLGDASQSGSHCVVCEECARETLPEGRKGFMNLSGWIEILTAAHSPGGHTIQLTAGGHGRPALHDNVTEVVHAFEYGSAAMLYSLAVAATAAHDEFRTADDAQAVS